MDVPAAFAAPTVALPTPPATQRGQGRRCGRRTPALCRAQRQPARLTRREAISLLVASAAAAGAAGDARGGGGGGGSGVGAAAAAAEVTAAPAPPADRAASAPDRAASAPDSAAVQVTGGTRAYENNDEAAQSRGRSPADAVVTNRVYFDIGIAGKPAGRIVIGLFGNDAPASVASFVKTCDGKLRGRGSRTAAYAYSTAWRILHDQRIDLGRVKQVDEINQSPGIPQRQLVLVEVPKNTDANDLVHAIPGTVSVKRGGGEFEFTITPVARASPELDSENVVIGRVLEGMDVVEAMNAVPTNQKTVRDGFRNIGKVIGDGRAKLDLEFKPLQKIVVKSSGSF